MVHNIEIWKEIVIIMPVIYLAYTFFMIDEKAMMTRRIGLGLSISLEILQEHGRSMHFESEPGKGTTVFVHLPIHPMDEKRDTLKEIAQ